MLKKIEQYGYKSVYDEYYLISITFSSFHLSFAFLRLAQVSTDHDGERSLLHHAGVRAKGWCLVENLSVGDGDDYKVIHIILKNEILRWKTYAKRFFLGLNIFFIVKMFALRRFFCIFAAKSAAFLVGKCRKEWFYSIKNGKIYVYT